MYSNSYIKNAPGGVITARVGLNTLICGMIEFLERFECPALFGSPFHSLFNGISDGDKDGGVKKLFRLLEATGYPNNPEGFFNTLISRLRTPERKKITLNAIVIPHLLLVSVLETIMPGNGLVSVKNIELLENIINSIIPEKQRNDLQRVLDTYPVRLSMHVIRQALVSENVAKQYLPFAGELENNGRSEIWVGQFQKGIIEQMYSNRVIFLLNMTCPVYCRFCFRKHKDSRKGPVPSINDVKNAVEHVKQSPSVKEVLITGGDPFLSRRNLECAISDLAAIPHVQSIRIATRSISYYPHLFLGNNSGYLNYLKHKHTAVQKTGKRMEIATHFIHPDEVSPQSLEIINYLSNNGVCVYAQTPVLKNCNDKGPELARLFRLLRGAGAELHYIFTPCSPIRGNRAYRTSISNGISIANYLRAHMSDRGIPKMTTATSIGKVEWHTSGWAVEQDKDDRHSIWIRTSFTPGYFQAFSLFSESSEHVRVNREGTIDVRFMAEIGDNALFLGARLPKKYKKKSAAETKRQTDNGAIPERKRHRHRSIVNTGLGHLSRLHETTVEIDTNADNDEFDYILNDDRITDVLVLFKQDTAGNMLNVERLIKPLQEIPHVNAVRLCHNEYRYAFSVYTPEALSRLGRLNRLSVINPQKIEIETRFLTADDVKPEHGELTRILNTMGIAVYNSTPILMGINDSPDGIQKLAFALRKSGIEFHHLYVAGQPIQNLWNKRHPLDIYDIIDIASQLRRDGSGREIPRYIIHTPLGDADYGLTSSFVHNDGQLFVKLTCYDKNYFKRMDPEFSWPEHVTEDETGAPVIPVVGLTQSTDFPI